LPEASEGDTPISISDTPLLNSSAVASRFDEIVPTLTEAQMARVAAHGHVWQVERGEVLVEAGERTLRFFFVVTGKIEIARPAGAS